MNGLPLERLRQIAGWRCVQERCPAERVEAGFTSDLLSDIMAHAPACSVLITLQAHLNTVAVATLADVKVLVLCSGRQAPPEMLEAARREGILVLQTDDNQYQASVKLDDAFRAASGDE